MTTPNDEHATEAPAAEVGVPAEAAVPAEALATEVGVPVEGEGLGEPPVYTAVDRPRGLNAYFAPGGEDAATAERRADERRNLRLLLLMVAALVLIPTLLTIVALAQELIAHRSG
jgi:hypothetical protein